MFRKWCTGKGVSALPASPATVAAFLAHEADRGSRAATITRRCAAIRYAHRLADLEPPTNSEHVRATLRGIRRTVGAAPARKAPVRGSPRHGPVRPEGSQGPPRPRAAVAGLRRRVSPVGAGGTRRRRPRGNRGRFQNHHSPVEDRPGRPWRDHRHRARRDDLPRQGRQGVAAGRRHQRRPAIPSRRQGRPARRRAAHRSDRSARS